MPPRYLTTARIAKAVGVHPNTVRLYEALGFLPHIPRTRSGYRRFTEAHLDQMRLAWLASRGPFPGGRSLTDTLIRKAAAGDLGGALELAFAYLTRIRSERAQADAAVEFLERWARGSQTDMVQQPLYIREAAKLLGLTTDTLRNWERNGLILVPRDAANGYRQYQAAEIGRLRVIRMLRQAGYSLMAILRVMQQFDQGQTGDLRGALDTPHPQDEVYSTADRWLSTLKELEDRALAVITHLEMMIDRQAQEPPPPPHR